MAKEGSARIVNFMTLGTGILVPGHGHISHIHVVEMHHFFKNLFFSDRKNSVYVNNVQGRSTRFVNFMTPWAGLLVLAFKGGGEEEERIMIV